MTPLLAGASPDTLAAAIEDHPVEYWRTICPHLSSAELHDGPAATWFTSDVPFFPFNQVLRVSLSGDVDAAIDGLLAPFRARRVPLCWNIGPGAQPPDLATRLEARRAARTNSMPGMALDLSKPLPAPAPPDGFVIERVRDAAAFASWSRAYNDGFDLPPGFVDALGGAYQRIGFADDTPFRHYVGLLNGEPVASSTMFLDGSVAGLWHITTLPSARRQGVGAAMTIAPLHDARDRGYATAILYASAMGEPLYQRLGFRELLRLYQYGWQFDEEPAS